MAITSESFGTSLSPQSNWASTWAKANAQAKKMKSQTEYLSDIRERLYLPQIQHSPTVQLYSKSYRLAAARRHPKRKRLQKDRSRSKPLQLPDIRQSWTLFNCENEASIKDEELNRPRRNSDPHLPPINKKQKNKKGDQNPAGNNNKLPISAAVDYTNTKSFERDETDSDRRFFESPSYPTRKSWKKQALYRRTLEPIKKQAKSPQMKQCGGQKVEGAGMQKESPPIDRQKVKSLADEIKEEERMKYRLQYSEQNIDDYRKEQDRKVAAARRIKAPPNSAKSVTGGRRRVSKQYSDKQGRKSKHDKASTTRGVDDSGISSKTTTELKRKESRAEESASLDQINLEEVQKENINDTQDHVHELLTDTKREWIESWLTECESARPTWMPVPGDPNEHQQPETTHDVTDGEFDSEEVKMPFGESPDSKKTRVTTTVKLEHTKEKNGML
ncbi:uncharacterized protein LOC144444899 [Glandiceps talaboti]